MNRKLFTVTHGHLTLKNLELSLVFAGSQQ